MREIIYIDGLFGLFFTHTSVGESFAPAKEEPPGKRPKVSQIYVDIKKTIQKPRCHGCPRKKCSLRALSEGWRVMFFVHGREPSQLI